MTDAALASGFAPRAAVATQLLPYATSGDDGSHDVSHLLRVWKNALLIQKTEGGDLDTLAAAVLLHDCVAVEKNSPDRAKASTLAAEKSQEILTELGWSVGNTAEVYHAVQAHSFSAGFTPLTLLARTVQDADRLDAIGMVGAARCFYIAGRMGSGLYDAADPKAENRPLDDKRYAIDHFETKLFGLANGFQTPTGRRLALERQTRLRRFLDEFLAEI